MVSISTQEPPNGEGAGAVERCLVGGPMATLGPFWEALFAAGEPWVMAHPFLQLPEARRSAVPIFLHADEAKYINKGEQKCYVVSISSLARGSAPATKFLVAALPVEVFTEETLWAFLDWVAFDLTALQQGAFPAKGWRGAELDPQRQKLAGRHILGTRYF